MSARDPARRGSRRSRATRARAGDRGGRERVSFSYRRCAQSSIAGATMPRAGMRRKSMLQLPACFPSRRASAAEPAPHGRARPSPPELPAVRGGAGHLAIGYWMQSVAQGWLVYRPRAPAWIRKVAFAGYLRPLPRPARRRGGGPPPRRPVLLLTQRSSCSRAGARDESCGWGRDGADRHRVRRGRGTVGRSTSDPAVVSSVEMGEARRIAERVAVNSAISTARACRAGDRGQPVERGRGAGCFFLNAAPYSRSWRRSPHAGSPLEPRAGRAVRSGGFVRACARVGRPGAAEPPRFLGSCAARRAVTSSSCRSYRQTSSGGRPRATGSS